MTRTGLIKKALFFSYSLQRTSPDFENIRKTMPTEKNQLILSWVVSLRPMHTKSRPDAAVTRQEQQEATTHCRNEFENQIF